MSRYARQMAVSHIGEEGQARIRRARVLQVGCGALGTVQAELLVRAGVGRLTILDRDVVELSNLQRQICFDEEDARLRRPKAQAAAARLARVNSEVEIVPVVTQVTPENILAFVQDADLVMDATDNFETRYLINDACVQAGIPWIYGGVLGVEGTIMPVVPGRTPCFRCLMPTPPDSSKLPTIADVGVLSTTVMTTASGQVTLALALLAGSEWKPGVRTIDVWNGSMRLIPLAANAACPCCVRREFPFLGAASGDVSIMWARNAVMFLPRDGESLRDQRAEVILRAGGTRHDSGVWEIAHGAHTVTLFSDGRLLVSETRDAGCARALLKELLGSLAPADPAGGETHENSH